MRTLNAPHDYRAVFADRNLAVIALLGFSSGLPLALTGQTLQAWMTVDGIEVTLKRLRRRGASIALEPANKAYETRIFGPDRVKVQGRLVGLLRRY